MIKNGGGESTSPKSPARVRDSLAPMSVKSHADQSVLHDSLIVEAVARHGGYEEVERLDKWAALVNALGARKDLAKQVKERYEDLLRQSAEQDELEDEMEEDYEVDEILDSRETSAGVEYLVKWKGDDDDDDSNQTWEPSANLSCPDLLEQFELRRKQPAAVPAPAADAEAPAAPPLPAAGAEPPAPAPTGHGVKRQAGEEGGEAGAIDGSHPQTAPQGKYRRVVSMYKVGAESAEKRVRAPCACGGRREGSWRAGGPRKGPRDATARVWAEGVLERTGG